MINKIYLSLIKKSKAKNNEKVGDDKKVFDARLADHKNMFGWSSWDLSSSLEVVKGLLEGQSKKIIMPCSDTNKTDEVYVSKK